MSNMMYIMNMILVVFRLLITLLNIHGKLTQTTLWECGREGLRDYIDMGF